MNRSHTRPSRPSVHFADYMEAACRRSAPPELFRWLVVAARFTQAVAAFARLGIAERLKDGPRSVTAVARAGKLHAPSLRVLLRALSSIGIVSEQADGRFRLTAAGHLLRPGVPGSHHGAAAMQAHPALWAAWSGLDDAVRTGKCPLKTVTGGLDFFPLLQRDGEVSGWFDRAMAAQTGAVAALLAKRYDFSGFRTVVDVGGGNGALLRAICLRNPAIGRAIVFDQPHVVKTAQERATGSQSRVPLEFAGGDFFRAVPKGADAYLLKFILHDWSDGDAVRILRSVRRAMCRDARVIIVESDLGARNRLTIGKWLDLTMLAWLPGGKERAAAEYRELLRRAGLRVLQTIRTDSSLMIVEAARAMRSVSRR